MKKELSIKILPHIQIIPLHQQAQIKGGAGTCGCSEEKKRPIKLRKSSAINSQIVEIPVLIALPLAII